MVKLVELDAQVTVFQQMEDEGGPVILINKFDVSPEDVDRFVAAWGADADTMKGQPGFISTQLHRGIGGSTVYSTTPSGNQRHASSGPSETRSFSPS